MKYLLFAIIATALVVAACTATIDKDFKRSRQYDFIDGCMTSAYMTNDPALMPQFAVVYTMCDSMKDFADDGHMDFLLDTIDEYEALLAAPTATPSVDCTQGGCL